MKLVAMAYTQTGHMVTKLGVTAKDSFLKSRYLMKITFSHLHSSGWFDKTSFLNAALTCKDFLDVALDALWETMYSWDYLLVLLPALQV